jgi:hypothetical protein
VYLNQEGDFSLQMLYWKMHCLRTCREALKHGLSELAARSLYGIKLACWKKQVSVKLNMLERLVFIHQSIQWVHCSGR